MKSNKLSQLLEIIGEVEEPEISRKDFQETPFGDVKDFLTKVLDKINRVIYEEMFISSQQEAQIPPKYIIFLNRVSYAFLSSQSRLILEKNIGKVTLENAKCLATPNKLAVSEIKIEIKRDDSLVYPMFQIFPAWNKEIEEQFVNQASFSNKKDCNQFQPPPLFKIKVKYNNELKSEMFFNQKEVLIGRGLETLDLDIKLVDANICDIQAIIIYQNPQRFLVTNLGKKAISIGKQILFSNNVFHSDFSEELKIGDYSLVVTNSALAGLEQSCS